MEEIIILETVQESTENKYDVDKNFWSDNVNYYCYEMIIKPRLIDDVILNNPHLNNNEIIKLQYYDKKDLFHSIIEILKYGVIPLFMRTKPQGMEELNAISDELKVKINKYTIGLDYTILKYNKDFSIEHILSSVRSLPTYTDVYIIGYYFTQKCIIQMVKQFADCDIYGIYPPQPNLFMINEDYYAKANKDFDKHFVSVLYSRQLVNNIKWFLYDTCRNYGIYDYLMMNPFEEVLKIDDNFKRDAYLSQNFIEPNDRIKFIFKQLKRENYRSEFYLNYLSIIDENKLLVEYFLEYDELYLYQNKNIFVNRIQPINYSDMVNRTYAEYAYKILYGVEKFNSLIIPNNLYSGFLSILTKEEVNDVLEYVNNLKKIEIERRDNRCEHVQIIQELKRNKSPKDLKELYNKALSFIHNNKEFVKIIGGSSDKKMLLCNICNLELICPHELIKCQYLLGEIKSYNEMVEKYKDYILSETEERKDSTCNNFCYICNGILYSDDIELIEDNSQSLIYANNGDAWKAALYLWSQYVNFTEGIFDKLKLLRNMINTSLPIIDNRLKLLVNKEQINQHFYIEANLVFVAYLLNIQDLTDNKIKFNFNEYMKNVPITQKKTTIKLIDTYRKQLLNINVEKLEVNIRNLEILRLPILITYQTLTQKQLDIKFIEEEKTPNTKKNTKFDEYYVDKEIMENQENNKIIYNKIKIINNADINTLPINRSRLSQDDYKILANYTITTFNKLLKYYQYIEKNSEFRNLNVDINNTSVTPEIIQNKIKKLNAYFMASFYINSIYPKLFIIQTNRHLINMSQTIGNLYDINGVKHEWDSISYLDKDKKEVIIPIKEVKYIDIYNKYKFNDFYSSKTKAHMSNKTNIETDNKIMLILLRDTEIASLFNYYTIMCPEGSSHKFVNNVCEKCQYNSNMTTDEKANFFIKYNDNFKKQKNEINNNNRLSIMNRKNTFSKEETKKFMETIKVKQINDELEKKFKAEFNVQLDNAIINTIATIFNVKPVFIKHLGALEKLKYEEVENGLSEPNYINGNINFAQTLYNEILSINIETRLRNITLKDLTFCVTYAQYIMRTRNLLDACNWMRYWLYEAMIELNESNTGVAKEIFIKTINDDSKVCKHKELDEITISTEIEPSDPIFGTDELEIIEGKGAKGDEEGDVDAD